MNLVKWFRKNNTKIMAVVVIVIMVGFIGGEFIRQLGQRRKHKTMAYLGDDIKITNYDLSAARRDLEVLKMLGADYILANTNVAGFRGPDLRAVLLGELLFSGRATSPQVCAQVKQMTKANGYRISDKQVNDIYRRSMPSDIYWLLLKKEAGQAGVRISNDGVGSNLAVTIPQLFEGATYSQLIKSIMNRESVDEDRILSTFGELLAVLEYARMMCSAEDVTDSQVMQKAGWENETIDVEFVKLDSAVFAERAQQPSEEKMVEHFNRYKDFEGGAVSEENPYGFGYKLGDRVRLEYIVVKLDDVSTIVTPPTQEEMEQYHDRYKQRFTEMVPSDVNDPNSPQVQRTRTYPEVADVISRSLLADKIDLKANTILQEAKTLAESGSEAGNLTADTAVDYETIAEQLTKEYAIKVYAGQTGLLSAEDMVAADHLGVLYLKGYGYNKAVGLIQVVFALDALGVSELGPFDVSKPKMYDSIGPARDARGQIMALVRATEAQKAREPESIEETFSRETIKLDEDPQQMGEDIYSVRQEVAKDLKKLAAMQTSRSKADELLRMVTEKGWEDAIAQFNQLYLTEDLQQPFRLEEFPGLRRIPPETITLLALHTMGNPAAQFVVKQNRKDSLLRDRLYSLVPAGAEILDSVPVVMESKPAMCYYCVKSISVDRLDQQQYEKIKAIQVYKQDIVQSQSLAAVHFNPENILKRMNFRVVGQTKETPDVNTLAAGIDDTEPN